MNFTEFSRINRDRCQSPDGFAHKVNSWSLSDWFTATLGELGEAANIAKKLNRIRDGVPGNGDATEAELRQQLADEIADTFIYLDLLAQAAGIDLEQAVINKFDRTSKKVGYPIQIAEMPDDWDCTPPETCNWEWDADRMLGVWISSCGLIHLHEDRLIFCPNCGRLICQKEDTTNA